MGTGAPGWELGGMKPEGKEVDGMSPVGGTPGLGIGGRPPGVEDGGDSEGPDNPVAGIEVGGAV